MRFSLISFFCVPQAKKIVILCSKISVTFDNIRCSVFLIHVKLLSECVLIRRRRKKSNNKIENYIFYLIYWTEKCWKHQKTWFCPPQAPKKWCFGWSKLIRIPPLVYDNLETRGGILIKNCSDTSKWARFVSETYETEKFRRQVYGMFMACFLDTMEIYFWLISSSISSLIAEREDLSKKPGYFHTKLQFFIFYLKTSFGN